MKLLKLVGALLSLLFAASCASTLPIKQEFYKDNKVVGVILQIDSISVRKSGPQGLLDAALTSGSKFKEPLKIIEPKIDLKSKINGEIAKILQYKKKQYVVIDENIKYEELKKFEKPNSKIKYSKKDFRPLKTTTNVDQIMYIRVNYGILVSYYGFIEIGKNGYTNISIETVDLSDNSLAQQENFMATAAIQGNWKGGEEYEMLQSAIEQSTRNAIGLFYRKF